MKREKMVEEKSNELHSTIKIEMMEITSDQIFLLDETLAKKQQELRTLEADKNKKTIVIENGQIKPFDETYLDKPIFEKKQEIQIIEHIKRDVLVADLLAANKEIFAIGFVMGLQTTLMLILFLCNLYMQDFKALSLVHYADFLVAICLYLFANVTIEYCNENNILHNLKKHKFTVKVSKPVLPVFEVEHADLISIKESKVYYPLKEE